MRYDNNIHVYIYIHTGTGVHARILCCAAVVVSSVSERSLELPGRINKREWEETEKSENGGRPMEKRGGGIHGNGV